MSLPQDLKELILDFVFPTLQYVMKKHQEEVIEMFWEDEAAHCHTCDEYVHHIRRNGVFTHNRRCQCRPMIGLILDL